ncbi:hypothetical protein GALMADRAFT_142437 [Galerina marginata CBS 339.88]|uniref:GDT1 family protein n=1 Tax=Galerina marginata (strain CBS 339.88) TaxID=685588 RepID=A0A067SQU8_GALM3|nr:hypothetical protein GALMADRAFT_142437 [Galerina marginata CBS 339.88]
MKSKNKNAEVTVVGAAVVPRRSPTITWCMNFVGTASPSVYVVLNHDTASQGGLPPPQNYTDMTSTPTPSDLTVEDSFQALAQSFAMIIFSEIGDKTFLIAAILAMRHPRMLVFLGAFGSLVVMSFLSAAMGHILPTLIPRSWTQFAAAVLFLVFGAKMFMEAREMKAGSEKIEEEMREAEEEIEGDDAVHDGTGLPSAAGDGHVIPLEEMEAGRRVESSSPTPRSSSKTSLAEGARNFCSLFLGPVFVQAFILTFLGEWGDRSQIATIALGAAHNVYLVTLGTVVGHSCCTALAVVGGRYVSSKISVKHVTYGGSVLFLLFGVIYLYEAFAMSADVEMSIPISADSQTIV